LERIKLFAQAKINLSLDVTGRLENGYHTLRMIMQTISLCDEVVLEKAREGIEILCDHPNLPCDERNICYKAAREFFMKTGIGAFGDGKNSDGTVSAKGCICEETGNLYAGVRINIKKRIPIGAGLAGGSSDAAAVLKGLNILYNTNLHPGELAEIGLKCGADVPFCIYGGTYLAEGIGERLTKLPSFSGVNAVVVKPDFSVSTAWVYKNYSLDELKERPDTDAIIDAIGTKDIAKVAGKMRNVLESVTAVKYPEINKIKHALKKLGALGSMMSGSGPAVFGLFENFEKANTAFEELRKIYKQTYLVSTTDGGEIYGENI
jgi:4-diphosphocytidyl-2-C-methyl-D-erythritol kinase